MCWGGGSCTSHSMYVSPSTLCKTVSLLLHATQARVAAHKLLGLFCFRLSYLGWSTMVIATSATVFNFYVILETRIHVFLLVWQALYPISILVSCWDFFKTPNGKFCGPGQLISCLCTVGYSLSNLSNSKSSH